MHKCLLTLLAALLGGCMSLPLPPSPPALGDPTNPSAPEASGPRLRPKLVATTKVYLSPSAGEGADKMDMSKTQGTGGMQGMDHSKMQGMETKPSDGAAVGMQGMDYSQMEGMDHSKMPGMGASPASADAKAVEKEMKQTSDEMKELSDELKAKSDAAKPAASSGERSPAAVKSAGGGYTCPMHPQINEAKPGNCPICGMTLIKKTATPKSAKP